MVGVGSQSDEFFDELEPSFSARVKNRSLLDVVGAVKISSIFVVKHHQLDSSVAGYVVQRSLQVVVWVFEIGSIFNEVFGELQSFVFVRHLHGIEHTILFERIFIIQNYVLGRVALKVLF